MLDVAMKPGDRKHVNAVLIEPHPEFISSHRTGTLRGLSRAQIEEILSLRSEDLGCTKSEYEWRFTLNGQQCSIWDWKESGLLKQHSTFGPADLLQRVFGDNYQADQS